MAKYTTRPKSISKSAATSMGRRASGYGRKGPAPKRTIAAASVYNARQRPAFSTTPRSGALKLKRIGG